MSNTILAQCSTCATKDQEIRRLSWNESLSMYNQAGGLRAIEQLPSGAYAVVFCDIDHLKALNAATGNHIQTNRYLAAGLKVRAGEIAMQFLGDEFVFVLGRARGAADPAAFVQRLSRQLAQQPLTPAEQAVLLRLAATPNLSATFAWRAGVPKLEIQATIERLSIEVLAQKARRVTQQVLP